MKNVNIANVNIDIHSGNIGLSASGGIDSSLLLFILMKYADKNSIIHTFTGVADVRTCGWVDHLNRFIEESKKITNFDNIIKHTYRIEGTHNPKGLMDPLYTYVDDKNLNLSIMYTGVTSNPPDSVQDTFKNKCAFYERRNPNITRNVYHHNNKWYTPFWNINKRKIAEMYDELSITELLQHTRSCVNQDDITRDCGECWWCEEKHWGFKNLL